MNYGKVEERSSSRSRSPNTARRAATSAILTDILSKSDRAPTSRTADARPGKSILIVPERVAGNPYRGLSWAAGRRILRVARGTPGASARRSNQWDGGILIHMLDPRSSYLPV